MMIVFPPDVLERLQEIEEKEGCPQDETVRTAVGVWTLMTKDERRQITLVAMRNALRRIHEGDRT